MENTTKGFMSLVKDVQFGRVVTVPYYKRGNGDLVNFKMHLPTARVLDSLVGDDSTALIAKDKDYKAELGMKAEQKCYNSACLARKKEIQDFFKAYWHDGDFEMLMDSLTGEEGSDLVLYAIFRTLQEYYYGATSK